jgi:hypothetical protein
MISAQALDATVELMLASSSNTRRVMMFAKGVAFRAILA